MKKCLLLSWIQLATCRVLWWAPLQHSRSTVKACLQNNRDIYATLKIVMVLFTGNVHQLEVAKYCWHDVLDIVYCHFHIPNLKQRRAGNVSFPTPVALDSGCVHSLDFQDSPVHLCETTLCNITADSTVLDLCLEDQCKGRFVRLQVAQPHI